MLMQWIANPGPEQELGLPYSPDSTGGRTNVGYFDLKRNPELIAQIRELRGYPELERLVRRLNAPESIFRTLRCDIVADADIDPILHAHSCYITVAFEVLTWAGAEENYRSLYDQFIRYPLRRSPPDSTLIQFRPVSVNFMDHNTAGFAVDIAIIGKGRSASQAMAAWRSGITALGNSSLA